MEDKKKTTIVVLSRNLSTGLGVIRSLGAAGRTVDLIASVGKSGRSNFAASSKYVNEYIEVVSKRVKSGEDSKLVYELLKYASEHNEDLVLVPTDDYTALVVDANRGMLQPHFFMPSVVDGEKGALTNYMNKSVQAELARSAGLSTPLEWIISLEKPVEIPFDMVYPCFVKPIETVKGYRKDMAACNDEEELRNHLRRLRKNNPNRSIIVQEFLEIDDEIELCGVCLDQKVVIPAAIKRTDLAQYRDGITLTGKLVPFAELGNAQENIVNMLKSLHYKGMFDMEFMVANGNLYFNEINLRSGVLDYAYFESGVNLPDLFVKGILGEPYTDEETKLNEYGKNFVYESAAWKDFVKEYITRDEFEAYLDNADIKFIFNEEDPVPEELYFRQAVSQPKKKEGGGSRKQRLKKNIKKTLYGMKTGTVAGLRKVKYTVLGYPQIKEGNERNPEAEKPRVVIVGRNYCSNLCMARGVGAAGYEVEILRIFQRKPKLTQFMKMLKPDAYSKFVKAYRVCVSRRSIKVVNALKRMADKNRRMLLIPTDDYTAHIVDVNYNELSDYYIMPNVDEKAGEINRLMSKEVQKELALKAGLPVLNSCVIRTTCGMFTIPETVTYPCFIKPNISKNSSKTKMRRCDSEEELRAVLTEYSEKKDIEMLIEDFVEIGREYSLLGISTREGVIGPGFFVAEEGGVNEHRGVALIGKVLPCSTMQGLIDDLIKFIGTLNYTGLYDVDLIETVDGKVYFVELNMRFGGSGYSITGSGLNLPGMFADYMLLDKPLDMDCKLEDVDTGKRFISEKILIEEYVKGRLTMSKIRKSMAETDIQFVKNDDDKRPYRHFKRFYFIAGILRAIYLIKTRNEE